MNVTVDPPTAEAAALAWLEDPDRLREGRVTARARGEVWVRPMFQVDPLPCHSECSFCSENSIVTMRSARIAGSYYVPRFDRPLAGQPLPPDPSDPNAGHHP